MGAESDYETTQEPSGNEMSDESSQPESILEGEMNPELEKGNGE